jgi:hypothetical protein
MNLNLKIGTLVTAASALALAVPAGAHPGNSDHPGASSHSSGTNSSATNRAQSHRCKPHNVAYVEAGVVDSAAPSTLAQNDDGTWSGTLAVDIARTNHWAKADAGKTVTYTFNASKLRVHFNGRTTALAAGEHVKLIGKLATVASKCVATGSATSPVFNTVVVHPLG